MVYLYNEVLVSHWKEYSIDLFYTVDGPEKHATWKKLAIKGHLSYYSIYMNYQE